MAKVQFGGGVTAITGSIGGWTFQRNRSGNIIRLRSSTFRSRTGSQNQAIADHMSLLSGFNALTLAQKQDWDDFAQLHTKEDKFGTVRTLTGGNWYESINFNRERMGQSRLDVPPAFLMPMGNSNFTFTVSPTQIIVTKGAPTNPPSTGLVWWATPPLTRSTTTVRGQLRFLLAQNSGPFGAFDITSAWQNAFGCQWADVANDGKFCLQIGLQLARVDTGIATAINLQIEELDNAPGGIGFMQIGSTFVVS